MNPETQNRRQNLRLIVSEAIMVVAVIITVVVLVLLVSGYHVNSDFEVERQGMLQIYSSPTGATVEVDGDAPWYQRTNTSKVLKSGDHDIVLTKEGYDTWSRTITISEGLLYRVHYPRLFLLERAPSTVYSTSGVTFATVSPDRKLMLLATSGSKWLAAELNHEKIVVNPVDLSTTLGVSGQIVSANWNKDGNRVLMRIQDDDDSEWILVNVKEPAKSVNLTEKFGDFDDMRIFDNSASNLLAISDGDLYRIDVSNAQLSTPLLEGISSYDFYNQDIVYTLGGKVYYSHIGSPEDVTEIASVDDSARVFISRFYEDHYITVVSDQLLAVFRLADYEKIVDHELDFAPIDIKIGSGGEFVFLASGREATTFDMEVLALANWSLDSPAYGWLDGGMIYAVANDTLIVYDFNGENRRELSSDVSATFPVTITDDKWLYYFSGGDLVREVVSN